MSEQLLNLTELALVWGPKKLPEPAYSFDDNWKSEIYTPDEIAAAILAVPNVKLVHPASPDWSAWDAKWQIGSHSIHFDIIECPLDSDYEQRPGLTSYWGGSKFVTHCNMREILYVWHSIQKSCPGIWLHDTDCRMYSPDSFERTFSAVA